MLSAIPISVELGHGALIIALVAALCTSLIPIFGWRLADARLMRTADPLAILQFVLVAISFAALTNAYLNGDFSVANVWQNSHSEQPLIYKLTGTWGNHEGSMLLWVLILTLFGASVPLFGRNLPLDLRALVIAVQSWITFAFLLFIVFTSNPFERLLPAPIEGKDLNPILQDLGLAIHPPLLYIGYVGFSMTFAFAVAALILGRIDQAWAKWVRPWTLAAWMFLTVGIAMGSYWAYYELGWGGWWFWDPVENASLMPWLVGTALLHSAIVVEKRNALRIWTVLLAILTFSLSLLGTFLVRSGVLTSVHSFASDPTRGVFILTILIIFIGGSLGLFIWRADSLSSKGLFAPVSREGGLVINNLFLTASCGAVLVGTLYPLVYEALTGAKISVGPPFFNMAAVPLFCFLLAALPFGPLLTWKRANAYATAQRLFAVAIVSAIFAFGMFLILDDKASLAPLGLFLGVWVLLGALFEPLWRAKAFRTSAGETFRRLVTLPRALWGSAFAHGGLGLSVIGIVMVSAFETETILTMAPGDRTQVGGYAIEYVSTTPMRGANFVQDQARFRLEKKGRHIADLTPAKRLYEARQMPTTEAAIKTLGFSQVYVALGEIKEDGGVVARIYYKPMITLIWGGSLFMFAGGFLSLMDRRLRIGAPQKRREITSPPITATEAAE